MLKKEEISAVVWSVIAVGMAQKDVEKPKWLGRDTMSPLPAPSPPSSTAETGSSKAHL